MGMGVPVLLLSARLSSFAVRHLFRETGVKLAIVSPRLHTVALDAASTLEGSSTCQLNGDDAIIIRPADEWGTLLQGTDAAGGRQSTRVQESHKTLILCLNRIVRSLSSIRLGLIKSLIAYDGSPLEYSWKWNTRTGEPDIHYSWEAIGKDSAVDYLWYRQFLTEIYRPDREFYAKELEAGEPPATTLMHAVEYNKEASFGLKSYFLARKPFIGGDPATTQEWDDAIMKLNRGKAHPGRDALMHFLANSPEGKLMKPNVMGMDNVEPSKSRLKMYFTSANTSFKSVREIMTMGGISDISEESLQNLRSMILAVLGLPADFPEGKEISVESTTAGQTWKDLEALCEGFIYFFDIAPTSGRPQVKFYLTTRKYGADDLTIARNLMAWMDEQGRGTNCDAYIGMLKRLAEHRGLENGKGMHGYISYQCSQKGEPDIKSYISPELYCKAGYEAHLKGLV
ncbi:dimethylallyl tryptophan synthase GliD1 [Histoplasma capsulatum H143]|uniref:Prenyltransferase nscD n=1 Tax=Ajellomyces capsulatus (strain H143) TaxID=544712 RepID=C6HMQ0_AJECH|nr:dimethylallyl tryptophan synthase GliD1 [Histoplasma capsulatum H143]